jgi:hypothetical protein
VTKRPARRSTKSRRLTFDFAVGTDGAGMTGPAGFITSM